MRHSPVKCHDIIRRFQTTPRMPLKSHLIVNDWPMGRHLSPWHCPTIKNRPWLTLQFMDGCIPIYKVGVVFGMVNYTMVEENYALDLKYEPRQQEWPCLFATYCVLMRHTPVKLLDSSKLCRGGFQTMGDKWKTRSTRVTFLVCNMLFLWSIYLLSFKAEFQRLFQILIGLRFLTKGDHLKTESVRVTLFVCDILSPYAASSFEVFWYYFKLYRSHDMAWTQIGECTGSHTQTG